MDLCLIQISEDIFVNKNIILMEFPFYPINLLEAYFRNVNFFYEIQNAHFYLKYRGSRITNMSKYLNKHTPS